MKPNPVGMSVGYARARAETRVPAGKGLAGVVLLAGGLGRGSCEVILGRPVIGLPLPGGETIASRWDDRLEGLANGARRLMCGGSGSGTSDVCRRTSGMAFLADDQPVRGTGGVIRDVAGRFQADDLLLVGAAKQVMHGDLIRLVDQAVASAADLVIGQTRGGELVDFFAVRAGALGVIRQQGYCDFKEQGIPLIARRHRVEVVTFDESPVSPVRSPAEYLRAVGRLGGFVTRDGQSGALVEVGGDVTSGARVRDSVVLAGGRVSAGAIVIDSVIGDGAVVESGQVVIRKIMGGRSGWMARI